jgi:hypothetical protein
VVKNVSGQEEVEHNDDSYCRIVGKKKVIKPFLGLKEIDLTTCYSISSIGRKKTTPGFIFFGS